jgi:hypothetical protein
LELIAALRRDRSRRMERVWSRLVALKRLKAAGKVLKKDVEGAETRSSGDASVRRLVIYMYMQSWTCCPRRD